MIKAIIFDCFGVLVSDSWTEFSAQYLASRPVVKRRAEELNRRSDMGLLPRDEWVSAMAVITKLDEDQIRDWFDQTTLNHALLAHIASLKPQYRTGLVSNVGRDFKTDMFFSWKGELFDDMVLSYKVALVKPDERVYRLAAQRLGVVPSECVYVDDAQTNVDAATEAGMHAILYRNFESFTQQLEESLRETTSQTAQN